MNVDFEPSAEDFAELSLTDDQERIIQAQMRLNAAKERLDSEPEPGIDDDDYQYVQNQLKEAGLLLTMADYGDVGDISNAVESIERYLIANQEDSSDSGQKIRMRERHAFSSAYTATMENPATTL